MSAHRVIRTLLVFLCAATPASAQVLIGPTPYAQSSDSPFAVETFDYFHLEEFEDGQFNVPGVAASAGAVLAPAPLTDSVDADDGALDGTGQGGFSFHVTGSSELVLTFDPNVLGALPTHAGVVWTDVGFSTPVDGVASVELEAFDAAGSSLGSTTPTLLGDGLVDGATAEDRFLGAKHAGGISRIALRTTGSQDWEVDHVQYGRAAGLYGEGCPGSGACVPWLVLQGAPVAGGSVTLVLENANGGASAFLAVGLQPAAIPMRYLCTLNVTPLLVLAGPVPLTGSTPCAGTFAIPVTIPIGTPPITITTQAFVTDVGALAGYTNTNGVELVIP